MTRRLSVGLSLLSIVLPMMMAMTPNIAFAVPIFNDFGPGDSYNTGIAYGVFGPSSGVPKESAGAPFTPNNAYSLSQISLALGWISGTNTANVALTNDNGGQPGTLLETWSVSNLQTFAPSGVKTVTDASNVTLSANTKYWVTVAPGGSDTAAAWNWNDQGVMGDKATGNGQSSGGSWQISTPATLPAFRVEGDPLPPVPEPPTALLMGSAGVVPVALAWLKRKRRQT